MVPRGYSLHHSGITSVGLRATYGMPKGETRLAVCMTKVLPTVLSPWFYLFTLNLSPVLRTQNSIANNALEQKHTKQTSDKGNPIHFSEEVRRASDLTLSLSMMPSVCPPALSTPENTFPQSHLKARFKESRWAALEEALSTPRTCQGSPVHLEDLSVSESQAQHLLCVLHILQGPGMLAGVFLAPITTHLHV